MRKSRISRPPLDYKVELTADSKGELYSPNAPQRIGTVRSVNSLKMMATESDFIDPNAVMEDVPVKDVIHIREVIFTDANQMLQQKLDEQKSEIAEKDAIIRDLTDKLNEFERISYFEFDSLDLPDDYYENDAYSDS